MTTRTARGELVMASGFNGVTTQYHYGYDYSPSFRASWLCSVFTSIMRCLSDAHATYRSGMLTWALGTI